jgi:hypothetical protein
MFTRPAWLIRLEAGSLLCASVALYSHLHYSWWVFGLLFLAPDVFMIGYLVNVRVGAALYNVGHLICIPLTLFGYSWWAGKPLVAAVAITWFSHIVFDRLLGYGLKYPTQFKDTHLQRAAERAGAIG